MDDFGNFGIPNRISDEEEGNVLVRIRSLTESNFEDWLGYGISFMKSIAIDKYDSNFQAMCGIWDNTCLLNDLKYGDGWAWPPLK